MTTRQTPRHRGQRPAIDRRTFLASLGVTGAALALDAGLPRPAPGRVADTIRFGLSSFPPSIRPFENTGTAAATVKLQIYRGLLGYDVNGNLVGELAESWSRENDVTHVFRLRGNARFHTGEPVTAADVKASYEAIADAKSTAFWRVDFGMVDRIETPDPRSVRIVLKKPRATFPYLLASFHAPVVSARSLAGNPASPVGAGPYVIRTQEKGVRIELERFGDYYKPGKPKTRALHFVAYPDENLRVAAIEAGDVEIIEYVPWQNMDAIGRNPKLVLDTVDGPFMYLLFNTQAGPFTNKKLRQAVGFAVKREEIINVAFSGKGSPLLGLPFRGAAFQELNAEGLWKYDLDRARKLMAEAGFPGGFSATLLSTAQYGMHKDTAVVVQQNLAAVGIKVELKLPDWATRVQLGNRGQYDFAVQGTAGDFNDPDAIASYIYGGLAPSYIRSWGFTSPRINELLDAGRVELDVAKRKRIYAELQQAGLDEAPMVGLTWRSQGYALQRDVQGFRNLPGFLTFSSGLTLEDTTIG